MIAQPLPWRLGVLSKVSQGQFCALVASGAGMYALVVDAGEIDTVATDITEEIGGLLEAGSPLHVRIEDIATVDNRAADTHVPDKIEALTRSLSDSRAPVRILSSLERLTEKDWAALNFLRSRLLGDHGLVFILDRRSMVRLQQQAPDLDNLLTASTWQLDRQADSLSAQAQEQRLEVLQAQFGLSHEEVIRKAENAEPLEDPAYAEWLVLLGRGNLLVG